jgi:hypothetical protein
MPVKKWERCETAQKDLWKRLEIRWVGPKISEHGSVRLPNFQDQKNFAQAKQTLTHKQEKE